MADPHLIAFDWGTSNLRGSLLGEDGAVLDTCNAAAGVMSMPDRLLAAALAAQADLIVSGDAHLLELEWRRAFAMDRTGSTRYRSPRASGE